MQPLPVHAQILRTTTYTTYTTTYTTYSNATAEPLNLFPATKEKCSEVKERALSSVLTYADVCGRMLTYAEVSGEERALSSVLTYADVCGRMLTYAEVSGEERALSSGCRSSLHRMRTYADVC
jgi:hypothetical protein